jgi:hypothetical protein
VHANDSGQVTGLQPGRQSILRLPWVHPCVQAGRAR